jgi:hypothetical protein
MTDEERKHLASLEVKYQAIRDRTTLCAEGFGNGAYIWGEGGIGKSFAVIERLRDLRKPYILHNTRLSSPAFFQTLEKHPKEVHVAEDIENIFTERTTMNLLRSALWGQKDKTGKQQRIITYGVYPAERIIEFEGQIIFTGNRPLLDIPELRALATRIPTVHLAVTRPEVLALMKKIALEGYRSDKGELTAEMCSEVLEFLIAEYPPDRMFDVRILIRCFDDRLGVMRLGKAISSSWKELVRSQLSGKIEPAVTRQDKIGRETAIALELSKLNLTKKKLGEEWEERTGRKTLDSYYRRLRKVQ